VADSSNLGMWRRWFEWIMWGLGIRKKGCRLKGEGATTNGWSLPLWSKVRVSARTTQCGSLRECWTPDAARPTHIGEGDRGLARLTGSRLPVAGFLDMAGPSCVRLGLSGPVADQGGGVVVSAFGDGEGFGGFAYHRPRARKIRPVAGYLVVAKQRDLTLAGFGPGSACCRLCAT